MKNKKAILMKKKQRNKRRTGMKTKRPKYVKMLNKELSVNVGKKYAKVHIQDIVKVKNNKII